MAGMELGRESTKGSKTFTNGYNIATFKNGSRGSTFKLEAFGSYYYYDLMNAQMI